MRCARHLSCLCACRDRLRRSLLAQKPRVRYTILAVTLVCVSILFYWMLEVLVLRKLWAHPRFVNIREDSDGQVHLLPAGESGGESLLCVDTYVQLSLTQSQSFPICIHEPRKDIYISGSLRDGVLYEHDHVRALLTYILPGGGLLDLGANLGVFSLAAAHLGYSVVAVEPLPENVLRLRTSLALGGVTGHVTVVQAAVSDVRQELYAKRNPNNVGGTFVGPRSDCWGCDMDHPIPAVFMDDLMDRVTFSHGVLKMDMEGQEERALKQASRLMDSVNFSAVLMEWRFYARWIHVPSKQQRAQDIISFFTTRDYVPCHVTSGYRLSVHEWGSWPYEILWRRPHTFL